MAGKVGNWSFWGQGSYFVLFLFLLSSSVTQATLSSSNLRGLWGGTKILLWLPQVCEPVLTLLWLSWVGKQCFCCDPPRWVNLPSLCYDLPQLGKPCFCCGYTELGSWFSLCFTLWLCKVLPEIVTANIVFPFLVLVFIRQNSSLWKEKKAGDDSYHHSAPSAVLSEFFASCLVPSYSMGLAGAELAALTQQAWGKLMGCRRFRSRGTLGGSALKGQGNLTLVVFHLKVWHAIQTDKVEPC